MREIPIPVDLIKEGFKCPLSQEELELAFDVGAVQYAYDLMGVDAYLDHIDPYLLLSLNIILVQEVVVRLITDLRKYLENNEDERLQRHALELMKRSFDWIYNNDPVQLYLKPSDNVQERAAEQVKIVQAGDQTMKLLARYLGAMETEWRSDGCPTKIAAMGYVSQTNKDMKNNFLLLRAAGTTISSMDPAITNIWAIYTGAKTAAFDQFERVMDPNQPKDLMKLVVKSGWITASSSQHLYKAIRSLRTRIWRRLDDYDIPADLPKIELDHQLHLNLMYLQSDLSVINSCAQEKVVMEDLANEKEMISFIKTQIERVNDLIAGPLWDVNQRIKELGVATEIPLFPFIEARLYEFMNLREKLRESGI